MLVSRFRPDIVQYAWVVPDLEAAARQWNARLGVGPFLVNRGLEISDARYRGRAGAPRFSTAVAQSGEVQIELVEQHDNAPSAYRDTVREGTVGFHHVAVIEADFPAALSTFTDQGFEVAADGRFGTMRYAYVDTSALLGCMVEIVEDTPAIRSFFGAVRRAAAGWDGDPSTLIRELAPAAPPA